MKTVKAKINKEKFFINDSMNFIFGLPVVNRTKDHVEVEGHPEVIKALIDAGKAKA